MWKSFICHGLRSDGSKRIVVEIDVSHVGVLSKSLGQGSDPRVINAILRHLNFLQRSDTPKGLGQCDGT